MCRKRPKQRVKAGETKKRLADDGSRSFSEKGFARLRRGQRELLTEGLIRESRVALGLKRAAVDGFRRKLTDEEKDWRSAAWRVVKIDGGGNRRKRGELTASAYELRGASVLHISRGLPDGKESGPTPIWARQGGGEF